MFIQNLEDKIQQAGGVVPMMRESPSRPDTGPITGQEVSNWRDEQLAWRETAALFDLSHHMTDLTLRGPDALRLVSELGVNSLNNFAVGRAKQFVAVNEEGRVIGDAIMDYMDADSIRLAGMPPVADWLQFHIETGDYDVTFSRDEPSGTNPLHHPELYRFQINGPRAVDVLTKAVGGPLPEIKFFRAGMLTIGGRRVRALGHNMSRAAGFELMGPFAESMQIREILLEAGREFGLRPTGSRAPTPATLESGWLPAPLPAIYDGDSLKAFREWLPPVGYEASGSLGGSFDSPEIADYYFTPQDLNYARLVNFDHDFLGRDALEQQAASPQRRKVTLVWNTEDVLGVLATAFEPGTPAKAMELPYIAYATWQYDTVLAGGSPVGVSTAAGYTYNERKMLSLAVVDDEVAEGSQVSVIWGEADGGSSKPQVERHVQTEIRATVARVPYSDVYYK